MAGVPLVRKVGRTAMQVAIPREVVAALTGSTFGDDDAFIATFGTPPRVVLEMIGDPPTHIEVWPAVRWQEETGRT